MTAQARKRWSSNGAGMAKPPEINYCGLGSGVNSYLHLFSSAPYPGQLHQLGALFTHDPVLVGLVIGEAFAQDFTRAERGVGFVVGDGVAEEETAGADDEGGLEAVEVALLEGDGESGVEVGAHAMLPPSSARVTDAALGFEVEFLVFRGGRFEEGIDGNIEELFKVAVAFVGINFFFHSRHVAVFGCWTALRLIAKRADYTPVHYGLKEVTELDAGLVVEGDAVGEVEFDGHRAFLIASDCLSMGTISSNRIGIFSWNSERRGMVISRIWGWDSLVVRMMRK